MPKAIPTSHTASAQGRTIFSTSSGRASVVKSRSLPSRPSSASRTEPPIADAPGIARVHWDSHQTTYVEPGRVARDRVEAWTMADRVARWTANLAIANDVYPAPEGFHRMAIWVADVDGVVVGWANTSAGRDADRPRDLELEGLYVLDIHHGTGVGQALLDAAIGDRPAYLSVIADNPEPMRSIGATDSSPTESRRSTRSGRSPRCASCAERLAACEIERSPPLQLGKETASGCGTRRSAPSCRTVAAAIVIASWRVVVQASDVCGRPSPQIVMLT